MTELPLKLRIALEKLYQTFSRYRLNKNFGGCSHCVSDAESKRLANESLRNISGDSLSRYAFKALTTWGDENDFRYFLPRILELVALDELNYNYEIIVGKLEYANWQTWDEKERVAIENYFRELIRYAVEFDEQQADITGEYISSIARVADDVAPYLNLWLETPTLNSISTLHFFVVEDDYGSNNAFLADKPKQRKQIVAWLRQAVDKL